MSGGFLSERWLGAPEPAEVADWSKMKYRRFIDAVGGWAALQGVLRAAKDIAVKHGVSLVERGHALGAAAAGGGGGDRRRAAGRTEHRADNLRIFDFALDADDLARLDAAFAATKPIPGDCGDEYRRPPFLTASGDLSHHLSALPPVWPKQQVPGLPDRWRVDSGSVWEPLAGYAVRVRIGERILVSRHHRDARHAASSSAVTMPRRRPSTSSTRSPPASPRWAARCSTWCARGCT